VGNTQVIEVSLRGLATSLGVNTASGIVQRKGYKWPPPPILSIRGVAMCSLNTVWQNMPQTQAMTPLLTCIPGSAEDIVAAVQNAEANSRHVHAVGSGWSFSDCAIGSDPGTLCFIKTNTLNNPIQTVQKALLSSAGDPALVYHVQAGITIHDLYTNLDNFVDPATGKPRPLGLITMGGASGQTIAGAVSTGTHGGDLYLPPLADTVLAIHLIGAGGTQYWIEPSQGITNPALLQQFVVPNIDPRNIIYDDETFDACLVSFGCMGVIYAVVLKVRDQYNLVETTTSTTWQAFMRTLPGPLNDASSRFLQLAVDPYTNGGTNTCLVMTRVESGGTGCTCAQGNVNGAVASLIEDLFAANPIDAIKVGGEELLNLINNNSAFNSINAALVNLVNTILSSAPSLRSVLTSDYGKVMSAVWPPGTCGGKSYCVMDTNLRKSGSNSQPPSPPSTPSYSLEVFFPAMDNPPGDFAWVNFVNSVISAVNNATSTFLVGYIGIRFMQQTRACLGMQQWPMTCSIEISTLAGVQGEQALLTTILNLALQAGGNPHWGQMLDPESLPGAVQGNGNRYSRYQAWRQIYGKLSNNFTTRTFENGLSTRWQLTTP
jgi:FAD binding domain